MIEELKNKYRPSKLEEVYGNKTLKKEFSKFLAESTVPHVLIFTGNSGCGKTTMARLIAKELDCEIIEKNNANDRGIESMREICGSLNLMPLGHANTAYIFDEFHSCTKAAQEVLLKVIEEPKNHVYMFLCTTDPSAIINTIKNRCNIYELKPLDQITMVQLITDVVEKEQCQAVTKEALREILLYAEGSPRKALVALDRYIKTDDPTNFTLEVESSLREGIELSRALLDGREWGYVSELIQSLTVPEETLRRSILGYANKILLTGKKASSRIRAAKIIELFQNNFFDSGRAGLTLACYRVLASQKAVSNE